MQLQKKNIELFFKVIKEYKTPKMVLGRIRDSFLRDLAPKLEQYTKDREEILIKFSVKKEDGTPDIQDNKYQFEPKDTDELNKELIILGDEEVEITPAPEIKNFIEETSYETKVGETVIIDEIITKL